MKRISILVFAMIVGIIFACTVKRASGEDKKPATEPSSVALNATQILKLDNYRLKVQVFKLQLASTIKQINDSSDALVREKANLELEFLSANNLDGSKYQLADPVGPSNQAEANGKNTIVLKPQVTPPDKTTGKK